MYLGLPCGHWHLHRTKRKWKNKALISQCEGAKCDHMVLVLTRQTAEKRSLNARHRYTVWKAQAIGFMANGNLRAYMEETRWKIGCTFLEC